MAHLIDTMAYTGQTPWHGLGNVLPPQQSLDIWLQAAGMDWTIEQSDVMFNVASDALHIRPYSDSKVLYRSDTLIPLSVVSSRYNVVQPHEVLHFYQDLVEAGGFELETAGSLKGGRKLWALAKTGQDLKLKGNDLVKSYLLLATSCDGTLCTTAQFTSLRVVPCRWHYVALPVPSRCHTPLSSMPLPSKSRLGSGSPIGMSSRHRLRN